MKKQNIFILLTFAFILVLAACSGGDSSSETGVDSEENNREAPAAEESSGETTDGAASNYPEDTIEMIFPFPSGGNYDGIGRIFLKHAEKYMPEGTTFAISNKTGGANTAGVTELKNAEPDGHTLGFVQTSTMTIEPHHGHVDYSHDSFQPIMKILQVDGYMFVDGDAPWETFEEWQDYVTNNPGEFKVSSVPGSVPILEAMKTIGDLPIDVVPFEGGAEASSALLGGHVDGTIGTLAVMKSQMDAGEVKPLFSTSGRELDGDIPTMKEKGVDLEENKMVGMIAPKGLPEDILNLLHDAFKQTLEDPEFLEELETTGLSAVYAGPGEFQEDISASFEMDKMILESAGMLEE